MNSVITRRQVLQLAGKPVVTDATFVKGTDWTAQLRAIFERLTREEEERERAAIAKVRSML
jgi:hypothetical protein